MSTHALRLILFVLIFCLGDSVFAQTVNKTTVLSYENGKSNSGARARGTIAKTPKIDKYAKQGLIFTEHFVQPSCTSGRVSCTTGPTPACDDKTTGKRPE